MKTPPTPARHRPSASILRHIATGGPCKLWLVFYLSLASACWHSSLLAYRRVRESGWQSLYFATHAASHALTRSILLPSRLSVFAVRCRVACRCWCLLCFTRVGSGWQSFRTRSISLPPLARGSLILHTAACRCYAFAREGCRLLQPGRGASET